MARVKKHFQVGTTTTLGQIQRVLVEYYMWRARRSWSEVIRTVILQYARADTSLDPNAFVDFVEDQIIARHKEEGADKDLIDEIRRQVRVFCEGNPTADKKKLPAVKPRKKTTPKAKPLSRRKSRGQGDA